MVSVDGRIDRVIMRNERTQAEILKIDAETGEAVSGAVLQIRDQEGKVIEEWISGTESHWVIGRLAAGEVYELWEKEAPEGIRQGMKVYLDGILHGRSYLFWVCVQLFLQFS